MIGCNCGAGNTVADAGSGGGAAAGGGAGGSSGGGVAGGGAAGGTQAAGGGGEPQPDAGPPPVRCGDIEATRAVHETGFNYILDPFVIGGDTAAAPMQSNALVLENGALLGPPHSQHADIRALGAGRFSQWASALYFSASDNSDPTTNGRHYELAVPSGSTCPQRAIETVLLDVSTTGYATFQSNSQKVVSNGFGYFLTYSHAEGSSTAPSTWRLVQSTDQGRTFQTLIEDGAHATRAPALETASTGMLYLVFPDWITSNSQAIIFNPADHTRHDIPLPGVVTFAKYAAAYDEANHLLYYSAIQSGHTLTIDTTTDAVTDTLLFMAGPHAVEHYPNLAFGADGLLYYGWTTTLLQTDTYYSNHFVTNYNNGQSWSVPNQNLTPPIIADDTGPGILITQPSDIGVSNWMDNMLPWQGKVHFVYTNPNGLRYVRYAMGPTYGIDKTLPQLEGETLKLSGLGNFFAGDDKTGDLYITGPSAAGGLATLISRDNGDSWHDYAQSVLSPLPAVYATGGARKVTDEGSIIGSFTDYMNLNVYFVRVRAER
jgi:hypothetical protein